MTKISTNVQPIPVQNDTNNQQETKITTRYYDTSLPADEFWRRNKRRNGGIIERLYNVIKNATNLGVGTKKVDKALDDLEEGKIQAEDFDKIVHKYSSSQETSAQLFGDAASAGAAGATFFLLNKPLKYTNAVYKINEETFTKLTKYLEKLIEKDAKKSASNSGNVKTLETTIYKFCNKIVKLISSNKKMTGISIGVAAVVGGFTKWILLMLNRIPSKEYMLDKEVYGKRRGRNPETKTAAKKAKSNLRKQSAASNFRNFVSGAVNGLAMPIMLLGGIVGTPVYLAVNTLNRYFIASKTNKKKSLKGYVDNISNDGLTVALATAAGAVPLVKKGNYLKTFNKNMAASIEKLANAKLKSPEYKGLSAYDTLEKLLMESSEISRITNSNMSIEEQVKKLIGTNIFAAKFKQISNDGTELFRALKENCPPTRTLEDAQIFIDTAIGESKYELKKLIGVGTVAETYLAKIKSGKDKGKEVCIKILKDDISADKINTDKDKFLELVKGMKDKSADEIEYLQRNVEDLAANILKEVDFKNEMEAANRLVPYTKVANVVKPIEVKNNVYVMEKANGVSLEAFMRLNELFVAKEAAQKLYGEDAASMLKLIDAEIAQIKSRMPSLCDVTFDRKDADYLLTQFQKVFIEQFHKIEKDGKIIHGDLHPGNIFIDLDVLKTKKGKLFTLIDTGNTIEMSAEQSLRALNFTKYVHQGNADDIAKFVLDGAKLPSGMTETEALEKVTAELKKCFFDSSTKIGSMNEETMLSLTDNIMQKFNIIPSSTQLNLNKSRKSARNSVSELQEAINSLDGIDITAEFIHKGKAAGVIKGGSKVTEQLVRDKLYENAISNQEKANLRLLTPAERKIQKNNPNAPKTNSEEYITYKLKQYKFDDINFEDMK